MYIRICGLEVKYQECALSLHVGPGTKLRLLGLVAGSLNLLSHLIGAMLQHFYFKHRW